MFKIFSIWMVNIAVKLFLFIALMMLATKVNGNKDQHTTFPFQTLALNETDLQTDIFNFSYHSDRKPYRPNKKSSLSDRQFAPAYRMRETPYYAVKTNILHDLTTSVHLGAEVRLQRRLTFDIPFTLNPWTFNKEENTKFKFFLFQPELRYWHCEAFNGHFFGLHGHYAYYNVGHLPKPPFSDTMNQNRFEGQLAGAGISYGYHWLMSPRLSIEAEIGAGYAQLWYDKYPCQTCAKYLTSEKKNYWGITRAGISLIYLF